MNKTCARCEKTVYPTEELKCLDKVWHKGCFKCQECGMTLNMRTYKGYGKLPYCEAHVPKAKSTTMAETPELKRIAENTKLQSNVKYHADFEKSKGKFTQVADDPETLRIKANTKIISNVAYHGDLEKKAQMEKQRQINENGELVEVPTDYNQQLNNYATEMLPPALPPPNLPAKNHYQTPSTQYQPAQHISGQNHMHAQSQHMHAPSQHMHVPSQHMHAPNHHNMNAQNHMTQNQHRNAQNHKMTGQSQHMPTQSPHMSAQSQHMPTQSQHMSAQSQHMPAQNQHMPAQSQHMSAQNQHMPAQSQHMNAQNYQNRQYQEQYYKPPEDFAYQYTDYQNAYGYGQQQNHSGGSKIGRIEDYDPVIDPPRAPPNTQRASATLIYNSTSDGKLRGSQQSAAHQQSSRQIGRVTDMDPMANEPPRPVTNQTQNQQVYIAMYDYEANDSDEVSFREGDLISNVSAIDEGWMTGRVLRSGRTGMLPANYVELAPAGALQHHA